MESSGLELNFKLFRLFGAWNSNVKNGTTRLVYSLYTAAVVIVLLVYIVLAIADFFFQNGIEALIENLNIICVVIACNLKIITLLIKRKKIIEMLKILDLKDCMPGNEIERDILHRYKRKARFETKMFLTLCYITVGVLMIVPFLYDNGLTDRKLPFRVRQLYSMDHPLIYVLTYLHDLFLVTFDMPLNASFDTLASGLMILACGQYELLCERLRRATTYNEIRDCIRHHQHILKFSQYIQDILSVLVFVQFFLSTMTLCCLVYVTALVNSTINRFQSTIFLSAMLAQLFLYCWNGNEVFSKSQGLSGATLNNEEWNNLSMRSKKALLIMSICSCNTKELKAGHLLNLSLETYTMILKTSYSVFNLLQQVSSDRT